MKNLDWVAKSLLLPAVRNAVNWLFRRVYPADIARKKADNVMAVVAQELE